jgi:predicted small lipoprotein YifL
MPIRLESQPVKQRPFGSASLVATGLVLAVLLSACGRRGPLEPPPGTSASPGMTQQDLAGRSTSGGSPSFRPARETDTGQIGVVSGAEPPIPVIQQQVLNTNPQSLPNVNSAAGAGLQTPGRGARRSPPPKTPFILDPLL